MAAGLLGLVNEGDIPRVLTGVWFISSVVAMNGEYCFGSKMIAIIILSMGAILFAWGVLVGFEVI
jgi:hypothetical protein